MVQWLGDPEFVWLGHWWAGVQHIQPGSACGTQPQEAWHRHGLKEFMSAQHMPVDDFFIALEMHMVDVVRQYSEGSKGSEGPKVLPDMPAEPWPDVWSLQSRYMQTEGRTGGLELYQQGAKSRFVSADGSIYYAILATHCKWDADAMAWTKKDNSQLAAPTIWHHDSPSWPSPRLLTS